MKILVLANNASGLYSFRKELLKRLEEEEIKVFVAVPQGMHFEDIEKIVFKTTNIDIDRRGTNPIHDIKLIINYFKLIYHIHPDCVLTYTIKPNLYGGFASLCMHIPYLMNVTGLGSSSQKNILFKFIFRAYKVIIHYSYCTFFQNKFNEKIFLDGGISASKAILIPGSGVNLKSHPFESYPPKKADIKFLFVARIMKEKGINELVNAARIIQTKYPFVQFHVVGYCEDGYEEQVNAWVKEKIIVYHGEQKNIHSFMKACDALIHPSFYPEGVSNVCLEAAATGRPVLTTRMHGCQETVEDGKTGILFNPRSAESLVRAIQKFLLMSHGEREQMGILGRKKMEKEFDRKIVINAYMNEIKEIGSSINV